ncbi:hypothetical protein LguiB_026520 [Lonicera macranthoides]
MVNMKAYVPEIVAIGPYHHNKGKLGRMDEYKKNYVGSLIEREHKDIKTFVAALTTLEPEISVSYVKPLSLNEDELIKMMVIDGCFIIELLELVDLAVLFFCGILLGKGHGDSKQEAGIRIEKNEGTIFDIKIENKTLEISPLIIKDKTDSILQNRIAHEQYDEYYPRISFVSDYVKVLDCLINSPKDDEILRQSGIIVNWKSNDEGFSTMFNDIYESVVGQARGPFTTSTPSMK